MDPDDDDDFVKSGFNKAGNFFTFCLFVLMALAMVAAVLIAGGWVFKVLFGRMTTSQYFQELNFYRQHPEQTEWGHWLIESLKRIRS